jgi:hypothetical protein
MSSSSSSSRGRERGRKGEEEAEGEPRASDGSVGGVNGAGLVLDIGKRVNNDKRTKENKGARRGLLDSESAFLDFFLASEPYYYYELGSLGGHRGASVSRPSFEPSKHACAKIYIFVYTLFTLKKKKKARPTRSISPYI